ncbi:MAG: hypothetical protein ACOH5I_15800 [Oligoflexus sp.]
MQDLESLIKPDQIIKAGRGQFLKPRAFQAIDQMPNSKLKTILTTIYKSADSIGASAVASLLNAAFTQGKVVILFSASEAGEMLVRDPNHKRKSTNGSDNSLMLGHLLTEGWLTCEVPADRDKRLPGVFVLRRDLWGNVLGTDHQVTVEEAFLSQIDACRDWLNSRRAKSNRAPESEVELEQDAPPTPKANNKLKGRQTPTDDDVEFEDEVDPDRITYKNSPSVRRCRETGKLIEE